jgi:hypothetical protein
MGNTVPGMLASDNPNRFPRVLFFTLGMVPTVDDYEDASKFRPNVAFRNGQAVAAMPFSPLEECDAVAGPNVPDRYRKVYPDVTGNVLRMSDLDRPHGPVTDADNEAARAAKPPSVGADLGYSQGAQRPAGAFTMADGGFVAPQPANPDNLPNYGSERAENAPLGASPSNPHGLSDAGITAIPPRNEGLQATVGGETSLTAQGGFTAPEPAKDEAEGDEKAGGKAKGRSKGVDAA